MASEQATSPAGERHNSEDSYAIAQEIPIGTVSGPVIPRFAQVFLGSQTDALPRLEAALEASQTRGHATSKNRRRKPVTLAEVPVVPPENELPELLDAATMAAKLGIPVSTLRRYSFLPRFPVLREKHLLRFWWRDTIEYVKRMQAEGIEPPSKAEIDAKRKKRTRNRD